MEKLLADAMKDPAALEYMEKMGHDINKAMDALSKMTPDEIEKQMSQAFGELTDSKMLDAIMGSPEQVLQTLEMTGMVGAEELAKMKADPAYFDSKMRESFGQVQKLFQDPEMAGYMTKALTDMTELFQKGGTLMEELEKLAGSGADLSDDTTIEKARKSLLEGSTLLSGGSKNPNPLLQKLLENEEMQSILQDTNKFRDSVKEGRKVLGLKEGGGGGLGVGAGIGEL